MSVDLNKSLLISYNKLQDQHSVPNSTLHQINDVSILQRHLLYICCMLILYIPQFSNVHFTMIKANLKCRNIVFEPSK